MDENERKFPRDLFSGIDGILLVRIWYHVNIIIFVQQVLNPKKR